MSTQSKSKASNANQPSSLSDAENWLDITCRDPGNPRLLGFLQLCADRRFHKCIQAQFQKDAGLKSPEDYWIHADAGGTPKMKSLTTAPDYCYHKKKVRLMGWAAHGNGCGGFGEDVPDRVIWRKLWKVARKKMAEYDEASHFVYFATIKKEKGAEQAVVYCMKHEKGSR